MKNNIMNLVEVYSNWTAPDKIITRQIKTPCDKDIALAVLVVVTADFNPLSPMVKVYRDTDSYQVRPKALYKSNKGIYYKSDKGRRYLTEEEIDSLIYDDDEGLGEYLK